MATLFTQTIIDKALANPCWLRKVSEFCYDVTPKTSDANRIKMRARNLPREFPTRRIARELVQEKRTRDTHGKYRVTFTIDADGQPTITSCRDRYTGETCKGFKFSGRHGACYHGACVSIHIVKPLVKSEVA
jgi:hypothetical protein